MKITQKFDLSELLGVTIRKTLEYKGIDLFTEEEFTDFLSQLKNDEEFLQAFKNIISSN